MCKLFLPRARERRKEMHYRHASEVRGSHPPCPRHSDVFRLDAPCPSSTTRLSTEINVGCFSGRLRSSTGCISLKSVEQNNWQGSLPYRTLREYMAIFCRRIQRSDECAFVMVFSKSRCLCPIKIVWKCALHMCLKSSTAFGNANPFFCVPSHYAAYSIHFTETSSTPTFTTFILG